MKEWSNYDFSTFIWRNVSHKETKESRHPDEVSVWLVRAGKKGEGEQIALEKNLVGIGYGGFEFDSDIKTLKQRFISLHPNDKIGSVNRIVRQIWNFLYNIKRGDFVVLPLLAKNKGLVAVGRIKGDYQANELHSELTVWRPVKWFKKDVPKSEFDLDITRSLRLQRYSLPPKGIRYGR